jgi:flagellar biogenesis protein FliO
MKTSRKNFWIVVLGLFLVIGLVAGGAYVLNEQGLISAVGGREGGPPDGFPDSSSDGRPEGRPDFAEDGERPERPDHHEGGPEGFNTRALGGLLKVIVQISIVVAIVAGGQWLFSWSQRRRRRAPANSG